MANTNGFKVGDLVFYVWSFGGRVYDGTLMAINEDGTFKIHDDSIGGTFEKVDPSHVFADRSEAEGRNEENFEAEVTAHLGEINTVEDLVRFMFTYNVSVVLGEADWSARKAAKIKAKQLLGLDLADIIDGK
ncbi:MAG: hypothetical protein J6P72_02620 [Firmicutes bacterium]|jgi:hypothetical protein|nr:hypothetical protein [Bacillota bacterium]